MANRKIVIKRRGKNTREEKPVYLIIAEGKNKTETLYFSNYQEQGRPYSIRFVKAGNNTDAESLYKTIITKWNELGLSSAKGDRGYIVLDIDNDPSKATKVQELMLGNKNESIRFVVSNPTFEVWFLVHFKYTTKAYANGEAVINDLKKYIPEYEKNKDVYCMCQARLADAIKNSDKLVNYHEDKSWPSADCNPMTDVGILIRMLEQL